MKACMIEPAREDSTGSIGAWYVAERVRRMGIPVDVLPWDHCSPYGAYDLELISIHHPTDYPRFQAVKKTGLIRLVGGHVTYNNPRPIIPLSDVVCLGDGETWIKDAVSMICGDGVGAIAALHGTISSASWMAGAPIPPRNHEPSVPDNPPYLNREGTLSAAWYIEISRGCPFHCHYCELGNSMPYRYRDTAEVLRVMERLDRTATKKIIWFAPDEASHPGYEEFLSKAKTLGLRQAFGSYRLDMLLKSGGVSVAPNQLIRVGIDGLTEETRRRVHKPITDRQIVEYFELMTRLGHVNFKIFQMFAHSWERPEEDFGKWSRVMAAVTSIPVKKNVSIRVKWTPLIPQPVTPLADDAAEYREETVALIRKWHSIVRRPRRNPGWSVECDGVMEKKNHAKQVELTKGDESLLIPGAIWVHPRWRA